MTLLIKTVTNNANKSEYTLIHTYSLIKIGINTHITHQSCVLTVNSIVLHSHVLQITMFLINKLPQN